MNAWPVEVNGVADVWLRAMARACWQGGLALGLVWLVCRLMPQLSARVKVWLWRLAFLKLLLALAWPGSIAVPLLPARPSQTTQPMLTRAIVTGTSATPLLPTADLGIATPTAPADLGHQAPVRVTLTGWLLLAWVVGVAIYLGRCVWHWDQTRRLRRACRRVDDDCLDRWCLEIAQRFRLRRAPKVLVTHTISQPLLLGPWQLAIVLPATLLANSRPSQLRLMLAHELAHAKQRDLWWAWLLLLGEALFYFYPLVWLARQEWRLSQEVACDALAVSTAESPLADYGAMLLEISAFPNGTIPAARSMMASIVETKKNLERRLRAMKFIRQEPSRRMWMASACLLCIATVAVLPWRVVAQTSVTERVGQSETVTQTKLVKTSREDNKALGFDWFLGNFLMSGGEQATNSTAQRQIDSVRQELKRRQQQAEKDWPQTTPEAIQAQAKATKEWLEQAREQIMAAEKELADSPGPEEMEHALQQQKEAEERYTRAKASYGRAQWAAEFQATRAIAQSQRLQGRLQSGAVSQPQAEQPIQTEAVAEDPRAEAGPTSLILDKKIELHLDNVPLENILSNIGAQEGVHFLTDNSMPALQRKLSVSFTGVALREVLRYLSRNCHVRFIVAGDQIRVRDLTRQALSQATAVPPSRQDKAEVGVRVFSLKYADAENLAKHLQELNRSKTGDQDAATSKTTVLADRRTNALIVQAPEAEMQQIESLLHVLDVQAADKARTNESATDGNEPDGPIGIVAPRPGFVQKVFVKVGQKVKKGDPLVQLDGEEAQGRLSNAFGQIEVAKAALMIQQAEAKGVRREYDRLKAVVDSARNVISAGDLEQKMTALEVAEARVAKAQAELKLAEQQAQQAKSEVDLLTIRAPRDGTVSRLRVQVGEYVPGSASQPLLMLGH